MPHGNDSSDSSLESGSWFVDLIMKFAPDPESVSVPPGVTPEELIQAASWKAFSTSTIAGVVPGPLGWATILPELMTVTKIQVNLIYQIAAYHGQAQMVRPQLVAMIFATDVGLAAGRQYLTKVGTRVIVRALSARALRPILQRIGARIGVRVTQRLVGRWIPFVLAPVFGAFSKSMTTQIGNHANEVFGEGKIEYSETIKCPNGHETESSNKFCPECGVSFSAPIEQV